jgi:hypothetical protein
LVYIQSQVIVQTYIADQNLQNKRENARYRKKKEKTPIQAKGIKRIKGQKTRTKRSYPPFPSNEMNQIAFIFGQSRPCGHPNAPIFKKRPIHKVNSDRRHNHGTAWVFLTSLPGEVIYNGSN